MVVERDVRDGGFTLLETIVVVLLVSVLASVMVAVVAVILRNAPSTEARVDNANSYRGLTLWMPRDAASTPPNAFVFANPTAICNGATAGVSLVQMTWTPDDGTPNTYAADYRLVDSPKRIERHTCWGIGAPYPNAEVDKATDDIFDATAAGIPDAVSGDTVGVTMTLTTCDPDCSSGGPTITFEARSHNPGPTNVLPPP
jgi:prepilin-type N-terminal cleavage/methylation domain-containing protein